MAQALMHDDTADVGIETDEQFTITDEDHGPYGEVRSREVLEMPQVQNPTRCCIRTLVTYNNREYCVKCIDVLQCTTASRHSQKHFPVPVGNIDQNVVCFNCRVELDTYVATDCCLICNNVCKYVEQSDFASPDELTESHEEGGMDWRSKGESLSPEEWMQRR
jgi:hypothetical protein